MRDGSCSKCGAHWSEPCWCEENEKVDKFKKLEQQLDKLKEENEKLIKYKELIDKFMTDTDMSEKELIREYKTLGE